jgi:predicted acylesterase/phospholipase RssA
MSMSVPLLWQEVEWKKAWGLYYAWDQDLQRLEPNDIAGHSVVDGGLLSNFPIGLFLSDRDDVSALVGSDCSGMVLGLLIDESLPVAEQPARPADSGLGAARSLPIERLRRLITTVTSAHDNTAKAAYARHIVHLPAGGYGTTEFDMTDERRDLLVQAGRDAMRAFLAKRPELSGASGVSVGGKERDMANQAPLGILPRQAG